MGEKLLELALTAGPWAFVGVALFLLGKDLIKKGFKVEVPPDKPKR